MTGAEGLLLRAVSHAARIHFGQTRKDGQTPYAAHPFRVCLVVRHVFGIEDPAILMATLLHDAIEDTATDFDDLSGRYGHAVASMVAALTKDGRLPEAERESAYMQVLAQAPENVRIVKLADIYDNLLDSHGLSPERRHRTLERSEAYLQALSHGASIRVEHLIDIVRKLASENEPQDTVRV